MALRLDVEFLRGGDFVKASNYYGDVTIEIDHTGYPEADTRRAITRAAAEIGKCRAVCKSHQGVNGMRVASHD